MLLFIIITTQVSTLFAQINTYTNISEDRKGKMEFEKLRIQNPYSFDVPENIRKKELNFVYGSKARLQKSFGLKSSSIFEDFERRGPYNVGGRTRSISFDSRNNDIILIASASGGLYRSVDGGLNWSIVSDIGANPAISGIAQDPINNDTWYYITGEINATVPVKDYLGEGVFKSVDNGLTWNQLSSTIPENITQFGVGNLSDWQICTDIAIDPINSNVFVTNSGGLYRSSDGGVNWSKVLDAKGDSYESTHIDIKKTSASTRVFIVATHGSGNDRGIFKSIDGINFTEITSFIPMFSSLIAWRNEIEIAPSNPNVVWFYAGIDRKLYKYDVAGDTWSDRSANLPNIGGAVGRLNTQGSYCMSLTIKPDNEDYIFVGGTSLYRSSDGFTSLLNTDNTGNTQWVGGYSPDNNVSSYPNHHADLHSLVFMPGSNTIAYSSHDGGISKTEDVTTNHPPPLGRSKPHPITWTNLNNGYYSTQAYGLSIDPNTIDDNRISLGFQDNGNWITNSSNALVNWEFEVGGGDGGWCAIVSGEDRRFFSTQFGAVGMVTGTNPLDPLTVNHVHPSGASGQLFINPFVLDDTNQNIMYYAGGSDIWRHNDVYSINTGWNFGGTTDTGWEKLTSSTVSPGSISALAVSKSPSNILYYGTSNGEIYKITNANVGLTPTRTDLHTGTGLPTGYVSCIDIDEVDGNNIFATFSNYGVISIYHSIDAGLNWVNVSGNLEENVDGTGNGPAVFWFKTHHLPNADKIYYVGTSTGLYSTMLINGVDTIWTQESTNLIGNVPVTMIKSRSSDGLVAVATHGRGSFSAKIWVDILPPNLITLNPNNNSNNVTVDKDLEISFSENIQKGIGNVNIYRYDNDFLVEPMDVLNSNVQISGNKVTLNPIFNFDLNTKYYVEITPTAFKDIEGNSFSGFNSNAIWSFTTENSLGDISFVMNDILAINPNPASDKIYISLKNQGNEYAKIELYNTLGQLIYEDLLRQKNNKKLEASIDVTNFSKGYYFLKIITPNQLFSKKLIFN